jgi:hypothetical protein
MDAESAGTAVTGRLLALHPFNSPALAGWSALGARFPASGQAVVTRVKPAATPW